MSYNTTSSTDVTRASAAPVAIDDEQRLAYPRLPQWYRKHTSFAACEGVSPGAIAAKIRNLPSIDCGEAGSSSVSAVHYDDAAGAAVAFEVSLFSSTATPSTSASTSTAMATTIVEVARVSGCTIAFNVLFERLREMFGGEASVVAKNNAGVTAASGVAPALASDAVFSEDDTREALAVAVSHSENAAPRIVAEGFGLLAALAGDKDHAQHLPALLTGAGAGAGAGEDSLSARLRASILAVFAERNNAEGIVKAATALAALTAADAALLAWAQEGGLVQAAADAALGTCTGAGADGAACSSLSQRELLRQVVRCVASTITAAAAAAGTPVLGKEHAAMLAQAFGEASCARDETVMPQLQVLKSL